MSTNQKPTPWRASVDGREFTSVPSEGDQSTIDLVKAPDGSYSYLSPSGKSLRIELESIDLRGHGLKLRIEGRLHSVSLQTPLMQLISELGLEAEPTPMLSEIHAPMPGLVLRVAVEPGQEVAAGDTLLVLEAMKMENAIKAPAAGIVTSVEVSNGQAVEKGALLLKF